MASFQFNPATAPKREERSYNLLPNGWVQGEIIESEVKPTKTSGGEMLKLTIEISTAGFRGRRVWAQINTVNRNEVAQRIGQESLRELCEALGVTNLTDTVQLHRKPFDLRVKIRKGENGYEDSNEPTDFRAFGTAGPYITAAPGAGAPTPPQAGFRAPPAANPPTQAPAPAQAPPAQPQGQAQPPTQAPATTGAGGNRPPWAR